VPRRRTATLLVACALALVCAAAATARTTPDPSRFLPPKTQLASERAHFLSVAKKAVSAAHSHWWDSRRRWYDDRLNDGDRYPLATIWSIVPLFEAIDGIAIAQPTKGNRAAVGTFAKKAERYFDKALKPAGGYAPYPGDRGGHEQAWFDDNGWWGLAFIDAYRATHNHRYLGDAARALQFIARRGWASNGGLWWNTSHDHKAGEALASGSALAARLYEFTHKHSYLSTARKFIHWGDGHEWNSRAGLYTQSDRSDSPISYIDGPMIGAHAIICRVANDQAACDKTEQLAQSALQWFGEDLNHGPQYDTIYLRWMLDLSRQDGDPRWYGLAYHNAKRVLANARDSRGLFLRAWDGGSITKHGARAGMIQAHGASASLLAWLAATPAP